MLIRTPPFRAETILKTPTTNSISSTPTNTPQSTEKKTVLLQQLHIRRRENANLPIDLSRPPSTGMLSRHTHLLSLAQRQLILVGSREVVDHQRIHSLRGTSRRLRRLFVLHGLRRLRAGVSERTFLWTLERASLRRSRRRTTEGRRRGLSRLLCASARGVSFVVVVIVAIIIVLFTTTSRAVAGLRGHACVLVVASDQRTLQRRHQRTRRLALVGSRHLELGHALRHRREELLLH